MEKPEKKEDLKTLLQKRIEASNWVVLACFVLLSRIFFSREFSLGVLAGGLISIANFYWLSRDLSRFVRSVSTGGHSGSHKKPGSIVMKTYLRLLITGGALYVAIAPLEINVVGLLVGLTTVVVGIVCGVIFERVIKFLRRHRRKNASLTIF